MVNTNQCSPDVVIRPMSDEAQIRRQNLRRLGLDAKALVSRCGKSYSYWRDLLETNTKSFGEKAARAIEHNLELPRGWLDQPQAVRPHGLADTPPPSSQDRHAAAAQLEALLQEIDRLERRYAEHRAAGGPAIPFFESSPALPAKLSKRLAQLDEHRRAAVLKVLDAVVDAVEAAGSALGTETADFATSPPRAPAHAK